MPSLLLPGPSTKTTMNIFSSSLPLPSFFFRNRRKQSYELNPAQETHQVVYLGSMLCALGKGDTCVDKPLEVIMRAWNMAKTAGSGGQQQQQQLQQARYQQMSMRLSVCRSGLRVETGMGSAEYVAPRITWSAAPSQHPRIFCWIYKHEGKRMKPELRCHAVLCRKAGEPQIINITLRQHLQAALQEYKREKLASERTRRISPMGSLPRRKALLQTGLLNFRPPLSRSRSVPRLDAIDEHAEEEEEEDEEDAERREQDEDEDEEEDDDDTRTMLSSSDLDLDSLNTADHYRPAPSYNSMGGESGSRTGELSDDGEEADEDNNKVDDDCSADSALSSATSSEEGSTNNNVDGSDKAKNDDGQGRGGGASMDQKLLQTAKCFFFGFSKSGGGTRL